MNPAEPHVSGDDEAEFARLREALERHPDAAGTVLDFADVAVRIARPLAAAEALERFLAGHADHAAALDALGVARTHLYRGDEAESAFARALAVDPGYAPAWGNLGWLRLRQERLDEALAAMQRAAELDPDLGINQTRLCWALRRAGRLPEAVQAGYRALDLDAGQDAFNYLAFALLASDAAEEAVRVCEQGLARHPFNVAGLMHLGNALAACGRRADAARLMDFERLMLVMGVNGAAGYGSLDEFNDALVRHVVESPGRPMDPTQTRDLNLRDPAPVVRALTGVIDAALRHYLAALPGDPAHPYLARKPSNWNVHLWGTRLEQLPRIEHHFHYQGWISGVYYARVPPFVGKPASGTAGCIEFVRFQQYGEKPITSEFMVVPPEAGLLVLFPSYFPHRVVEFPKSPLRVSLAFNVMPPAWGFHQREM